MTYADKESAVTAAAGYKKWVDPLSQKIFISSISQYFIYGS
jgi:hypothetical protein